MKKTITPINSEIHMKLLCPLVGLSYGNMQKNRAAILKFQLKGKFCLFNLIGTYSAGLEGSFEKGGFDEFPDWFTSNNDRFL